MENIKDIFNILWNSLPEQDSVDKEYCEMFFSLGYELRTSLDLLKKLDAILNPVEHTNNGGADVIRGYGREVQN